jgi:hypothetical protein
MATNDEAPAEKSGDTGDDMRRQFREALERKHGHGAVGAGGADGEAGKPHHASGPAKAQRTFRRKSGG